MTDPELFDALDGLFAYDTGCVSSGIKDEVLRAKVNRELDRPNAMKRLTRFVVERYSPDKGYTLEDYRCFIKWLSERMGYDV